MNIIWLTPEVPFPPIGGRNGVYNRIVQLSRNNRIFLFSIAYNEAEKNDTCEMEKYCQEVHYYDRSEHMSITLLKSVVYPYSVASRSRKDIIYDLEKVVSTNKIDIIINDFPNMSKNLLRIKKNHSELICTLNEHNVEYIRMRELYRVKNIAFLKRLAYYLESYRLEFYEKYIYRKGIFKGISFFSDNDYSFFNKKIYTNKSKLMLIPLGANDYGLSQNFKNHKTLLFVGRLDSIAIPNIEAVDWFVSCVWNKVLDAVPDARLIIAGANPTEAVLALNSKSIEIIPNFKDIKSIYSKTDCVILPLLSGGGVKGKLLEAVAMRKHIISTDHGIEGTDFIDKEHVTLANDSSSFAQACIDFLKRPDTYSEQEHRAYKLFKAKYDWEAVGKIYEQFLKDLI